MNSSLQLFSNAVAKGLNFNFGNLVVKLKLCANCFHYNRDTHSNTLCNGMLELMIVSSVR